MASAIETPATAVVASRAAPGVDQAVTTGLAVPQREADAGDAHADAQGQHPGADAGRVGAGGPGRLEDDDRRAGVADQHGDEAGHDGGGGDQGL